jgi:hypothetical protein
MKRFILAILVIGLVGTVLGGCGVVSISNVVSLADYNQIQTGMSYTQVESIIGSPGTETAHTHMDGVSGVMPSIDDVIYSWQNADGSNMLAMFQNDRLTTKAQAGLH